LIARLGRDLMARLGRDLMAHHGRDLSARPEEAPLVRRLGWMALIWAVSIAALGLVSLLLRWWLK
jgi:hypothetical protein